MADPQNGYTMFKPTRMQRFWRWLGFRFGAHAPHLDDLDEVDTPYCVHVVVTHWDWSDRLRILVSGKTAVQLRAYSTEPHPTAGPTTCAAAVLMPGDRG